VNGIAIGFWGAFFGTAGLLLGAALLAFHRSVRRVALTGSLAAILSAVFVLVFLGWIPGQDAEALMRLQAHLAAVSAAVLGLLLLWLVGALRGRGRARQAGMAMAQLAMVVRMGWLAAAGRRRTGARVRHGGLVAAFAFATAVRTALQRTQPGWLPVAGVACMGISVACLTWHAFHIGDTPVAIHVVGALTAIGYLVAMAAAMWVRYSYLIEVREAMVHGPSFDPVTRMRSHFETRLMVGEAFSRGHNDRPIGVIVVSIANLEALEHLHGRAAFNHGLFLCASRLRRLAPAGVELGRVGEDGFLLLMPRPSGPAPLVDLAGQVVQRLARPVVLGTSQDMAALESSRTQWVADVGVGVLIARPDMRAASAVAGARAMSRTAWSYASRIACYDEDSRQIAELPVQAAAAR